jgi:hypothetical protein
MVDDLYRSNQETPTSELYVMLGAKSSKNAYFLLPASLG